MAEREAALVQQGRGEEEEDEPFHALLELFGNLQEEVRPPAATRKKRWACHIRHSLKLL
jgi:hypothetical protein